MNYLKKIGVSLGYTFGVLLLSLLFIVVLHYFNILGTKTTSVLKLIILISSLFIGGYINGKKSKENGWLEGLKMGLILIGIFIIMSTIFSDFSFSLKTLLFYLIMLGITTFGSMVGVSKQVDNSLK